MKSVRLFFCLIFLASTVARPDGNVTITANGNDGTTGPVVVNAGEAVSFDALVDCATGSGLVLVPGTEQPKKPDTSEIAWTMENQTGAPITIVAFGVSWTCINDPDGVCANWRFHYVELDKQPGIPKPDKEFKSLAPVPTDFPITPFTDDPNNFIADKNKEYFKITPNQQIRIAEVEFVNDQGKKYKNLENTGLEVAFDMFWEDDTGLVYRQSFTITW